MSSPEPQPHPLPEGERQPPKATLTHTSMSKRIVILGGGLAGLSCGYELAKRGHSITILEREPHVGGMASSFIEDGDEYWTHDFGPHRFHSSDENLIEHVKEILGDNVVWADRLSRIVLFNKFFDYPLNAKNALTNMPFHLTVRAFLDYFWVRTQDRLGLKKFDDKSFETWVTRRFGKTLYRIFFGQYTEKAWGMPPSQISADWASQRITLLNLLRHDHEDGLQAGEEAAPRARSCTDFMYPKHRRHRRTRARLRARRSRSDGRSDRDQLDSPAIKHAPTKAACGSHSIEFRKRGEKSEFITGDEYINDDPGHRDGQAQRRPAKPPEAGQAGDQVASLNYVAIVFVYLKINKRAASRPDNWVYLPEKGPDRPPHLASSSNFSEVPARPPGKTMICAEITCRRGDEIWRMGEDDLRDLAERDLVSVGLIDKGQIEGAFIKRIPYAYPVYDLEYAGHLEPIQKYLAGLKGMVTTGRQGNFRYNNMDQSVEMGRKVAGEIHTGESTGHQAVATGKEYFG